MKRFIKTQLSIVGALSCATMFAVGFAAWQITVPASPATSSASIVTDDVFNSNNYVYFDMTAANGPIEYFTYFENGFRNGNQIAYESGDNTKTVGAITAHLTLDLTACKEYFQTNSLYLQPELKYIPLGTATNPLQSYLTPANTTLTYSNTTVAAQNALNSNNVYTSTLKMENVLQSISADGLPHQILTLTLNYKYVVPTANFPAVFSVFDKYGATYSLKIKLTGI